MQLFYTPDIDPNSKDYFLNEEESRHCVNVLRLKNGDEVSLVDGKGGLYSAKIVISNPKKTLLLINSIITEFKKPDYYLNIAVAPTKNIERFEWFLEKATEIGINEISPVICHRSERKEIKLERLNRIITAAMKQSVKAYHPILNEPVSIKQLLSMPFGGQKFIAHCENTAKTNLRAELITERKYLILIGPEGDFADFEIGAALTNGFKPISLGDSRLRTETAALEACFEVNFLNR